MFSRGIERDQWHKMGYKMKREKLKLFITQRRHSTSGLNPGMIFQNESFRLAFFLKLKSKEPVFLFSRLGCLVEKEVIYERELLKFSNLLVDEDILPRAS